MSIYTEVITLTIPIALLEIAKQISRAMDPDVGGYNAFQIPVDENGELIQTETISYTTRCTTEFADAIMIFKEYPELLHDSVVRDYELRWPTFVPPTLEDCVLFCQAVIINREN